MRHKRITVKRLATPDSETTEYIDYSVKRKCLEVGFRGGRAYQYLNVEIERWEDFRRAILAGGSSGTYINTIIKPNYQFKALSD